MSAGYFGSFFRRLAADQAREEESQQESMRASEAQRPEPRTVEEPVQSEAGDVMPVRKSRLGWLVDFIDDEGAASSPASPDSHAAPGISFASSQTPASTTIEEDALSNDPDELRREFEQWQHTVDGDDDDADAPYWKSDPFWNEDEDEDEPVLPSESYPSRPDIVTREIDHIDAADSEALCGDGYSSPSDEPDIFKQDHPRNDDLFERSIDEPGDDLLATPRDEFLPELDVDRFDDDADDHQPAAEESRLRLEVLPPVSSADDDEVSVSDVLSRLKSDELQLDQLFEPLPREVELDTDEEDVAVTSPTGLEPLPEDDLEPPGHADEESAKAIDEFAVSGDEDAGEEVEEEGALETLPDAPIDEKLIEDIRRKDRVVAMLLRKEIVDQQEVANAQQQRERLGKKEVLWRVLASLPTVDKERVYAEAAQVYAFKTAELGDGAADVEFARSVMGTFPEEKREQLLKLLVLPFQAAMEGRTGAIKLTFITHDPTRPELHRLMQELKLERFELRYAPEPIVKAFIGEAFPKKNEYLERMADGSMRYDLGAAFDDESRLVDEEALEAEISRSSLINLFEATLVEAVRRGASDIHIYPNAQKHIEVHFRVDGRLGHWHTESKVHPEALLAVIKDNAMNVDRFERDSAQDGFIQRWIDDALIRFRVSVLPIANATQELRSESIVIRVLDDRKVITDLTKLGLLETAKERFEMAIRQPHGMVILTGPTGSGKSTTLVAAMHQVVTPEVNVLTVEDPVEYIIPGVRQIKLNNKLGLEEALRAILRHDPDVVMVGEMRDRQTADLAIKLANTGHLTFSTLHTNDAPSAVSRLYKMGIEPFLIAYAINMVVAQRLIRTLCPDCKQVDHDPDHVMLRKLGFSEEDMQCTIYRPGNNPKCKTCKGTNYKGRRAVTEALYFSRAIRHLIVEAQNMIDEEAIRKQAVKEGMLTLRDSAREIVKMGETSVTEMIRVVTTES